MTIEKGAPWGSEVERPPDLRVVPDDAQLAAALNRGEPAVAASGGDLHRTINAAPIADRRRLMALPVDLIEVDLADGRRCVACAHVFVHLPWWRGGWLRGEVRIAMNSEFLHGRDVAPRGHPNDGRLEEIVCDRSMPVRQRVVALRRSRRAQHLPHPQIRLRSTSAATWEFGEAMNVRVDGRRVGRARRVSLEVRPDAGVLYA